MQSLFHQLPIFHSTWLNRQGAAPDAADAAAEVAASEPGGGLDTSDRRIQTEAGKIGPAADSVGGIPVSALVRAGADPTNTSAITNELVPPVETSFKPEGEYDVAQAGPNVASDASPDIPTVSPEGEVDVTAQATRLQKAEAAALEVQIAAAVASGDTELLDTLNAKRQEIEAGLDGATERVQAVVDYVSNNGQALDLGNMTLADFLQEIFARMENGGSAFGPGSSTDIHGGTSGTHENFPSGSMSEMFPYCESIAAELGVDAAAVKAVVEVESAGQMNATRFEPHIHARYPNVPEPKRTQLSTSYGAFQIMGFNHEICGYASPQDMIDDMKTPEGQLRAFAGFIKSNPAIHNALRNHNWPAFARGYNGPAYAKNRYDQKMAAAYNRYSNDRGVS